MCFAFIQAFGEKLFSFTKLKIIYKQKLGHCWWRNLLRKFIVAVNVWLCVDYQGKACVATKTHSKSTKAVNGGRRCIEKLSTRFFAALRWLHACQNVFWCTKANSLSSHWIKLISTSSLHALNKTKTPPMMSNCLWQRQGHYSNWKISSTRNIPDEDDEVPDYGRAFQWELLDMCRSLFWGEIFEQTKSRIIYCWHRWWISAQINTKNHCLDIKINRSFQASQSFQFN